MSNDCLYDRLRLCILPLFYFKKRVQSKILFQFAGMNRSMSRCHVSNIQRKIMWMLKQMLIHFFTSQPLPTRWVNIMCKIPAWQIFFSAYYGVHNNNVGILYTYFRFYGCRSYNCVQYRMKRRLMMLQGA